jgi:hypothetical protein
MSIITKVGTVQIFVVKSDKHNMYIRESAPKMVMMMIMMMTMTTTTKMVMVCAVEIVVFWMRHHVVG